MTIKSRLFFSNILMIALPIILTIVMGISVVFVLVNATSIQPNPFGESEVTYVHANGTGELLQKNEYTQLTEAVVVYQSQSDSQNYLMVFPDNVTMPKNFERQDGYNIIPILVILLMVAIVYFTNLILTRYIFRSIMSPIDVLVNGVHEIRDGNLNYRIEYKNNDEFAAVCSDFNEMAVRLLDMVNQRQKDEQIRRELIAGISHDLRTPLTSIKSYVKGLQDGVANNPAKEKEYLEVTYRKTCEMEKLIDHLFLFSKLEIGNFPFHFKRLSIHNYMVTVLDSLEYDLRNNGGSISLNSSCTNQKVLLDGEQMGRVISNILDNSIKHNQGKDIHIDVTLYQENNSIMIRLQDDGQGVSKQQLTRLFDIFYRSDQARSNPSKGNGLGLSIAKKIVIAHGGKITAENADGLAIVIELPIEISIEAEEKNETHFNSRR